MGHYDEQIKSAIWEAAWFAVNEKRCRREEFIAVITQVANEAFDSQVANASMRSPHTWTG